MENCEWIEDMICLIIDVWFVECYVWYLSVDDIFCVLAYDMFCENIIHYIVCI